ncbi:DNA repair and recombination RAD54 [Micractinium conductrix]|uniref:DNA repair and recombination RAD54 n=1 Tax=Micractinium conductrix TaxID=554055 RepID=A0A2P6V0N5_9CHLO|nr:DNA repair and recombination RAD54 [Micractinium conductrix]|eukprot:PSC67651.1 DNA repair and recombination RAD54 [Micractinium conductrix]
MPPSDSEGDEATGSDSELSCDDGSEYAADDAQAEEESEGDGEKEVEEEAGAAAGGRQTAAAVAAAAADSLSAGELEQRRQDNIRALVSGTGLALRRQALLPRLLTVQQAAVVLRRPFVCPHPGAPAVSDALKRKLAARKAFVPWGGGSFVTLKLRVPLREPEPPLLLGGLAGAGAAAAPAPAVVLPPGIEPLVLWEPPADAEGQPVRVDDMLTQFLRPHQREGVQFMFECVCGLRSFQGQGCILADDMGLGKTLQGISLLWTLLSSPGHALLGGAPIAKRVVICCPTSLVGNWDSECQKWLKGRVRTLPLCESSRDEAVASISQFLSPRNPYQVMIVSYETFRIHAERFRAEGTCDLLICDEAHRLKNDATLTNRALDSLACRRRVLLSGTPLQNRLDEFYAMVSFCNPGVLGSPAQFRRHFESPVLAGREPDASEDEKALCQERTAELSTLVNKFILRRTNTLLSEHLPPKVVEIVCCKMTPLQLSLYCHYLESKATRSLFATQKAARVLSAITSLRKLINHPKLIWDALHGSVARGEEASKEAEGFENCLDLFPANAFGGRSARGGMAPGWELLSGKFAVLAGMLELLRTCTKDRIVIVSNYTQTLDLVSQLCRDRGYPFVRLDGTTSIKKRNSLVKDFNDQSQNQFAFLLSSKAGGCGLNLIGGNRLVLFDPSWNPADDKQAAARVWRDGQHKKVYVYRFMAAGTIEEKVYQRQLSKEGLQQVVDSKAGGKSAGPNLMSVDELRDLFTFEPDTLSSTYDSMAAAASGADPPFIPTCVHKREDIPLHRKQVGKPGEEQLRLWGHHTDTATVPDQVMQRIGNDHVTFVFSLEVDGRAIDPEPPLAPLGAAAAAAGGGGGGLGARRGALRPAMQPAVAPKPAAPAAPKAAAAPQAAPAPRSALPLPPPPPAAPAKENSVGGDAPRAAPPPGSRLALPARPKQRPSVAAAPAAARPAPGLAAAVQRAFIDSDSDDDFK